MQKLSLAAVLVLLAACGSGGLNGLGTTPGGGPSLSNPASIVGTVNRVDAGSQTINIDVSYVNSARSVPSNRAIYYDSRTRVVYQDNAYRPTDVQLGDEIEIRGANSGGRYRANTITVTRDIWRVRLF